MFSSLELGAPQLLICFPTVMISYLITPRKLLIRMNLLQTFSTFLNIPSTMICKLTLIRCNPGFWCFPLWQRYYRAQCPVSCDIGNFGNAASAADVYGDAGESIVIEHIFQFYLNYLFRRCHMETH